MGLFYERYQEGGDFLLGSLLDLSFNKFIALQLIKYVYIFMIVCAVLASIGILSAVSSAFNIILGLIAFALSLLFMIILSRLTIETMIVLFKIAENTSDMAKSLKQQ